MAHKDWDNYYSSEEYSEEDGNPVTKSSFFEDFAKVQNKDDFSKFIEAGIEKHVKDENTKNLVTGLLGNLNSEIDDSVFGSMKDLFSVCEIGKKEGKSQQEMTFEFLEAIEKTKQKMASELLQTIGK